MTEIVILGGGMVAGCAAREMVEQGLGDARLTILSDDTEPPYHRPPLSKGFLAGEEDPDEILINDRTLYDSPGLDLRLRTRVERADLDGRSLTTADGDRIPFERLLIATGARPRTLPVPGADLRGVHTLRSMDDSRSIRNATADTGRAVVVGAGFIGTEVAAVLAEQDVDVTLVYRGERILQRLFTPDMSRHFEALFREHGVTLVPGHEVRRFLGDGAVDGVEIVGGDRHDRLQADLVVLGVGVEPATGLFDDSTLSLDDGIVVDETLGTGVDGVWAAGDVARYRDRIFDTHRRVEHWDNAVEQGKLAGRNLLAEPESAEAYDRVPYFFSDVFDLSWELWGDPRDADEAVVRGELAAGRFSTWWLRDSRLVAAFVMDRPDDERAAAEQLIRSRVPQSAAQLSDPELGLEIPDAL